MNILISILHVLPLLPVLHIELIRRTLRKHLGIQFHPCKCKHSLSHSSKLLIRLLDWLLPLIIKISLLLIHQYFAASPQNPLGRSLHQHHQVILCICWLLLVFVHVSHEQIEFNFRTKGNQTVTQFPFMLIWKSWVLSSRILNRKDRFTELN